MDLKEIAEAYQLVYEKKAEKDYDGDGKIESGKEEYFGSRDKAIKKAMGKDVEENGDDEKDDDDNGKKKSKKKDDDNKNSKDLSAGQKKLPPQLQKAIAKKNESLDLVSAYYSMYEHHKKDEDGNTIPHEDEINEGIDLSFIDEISEEELDILVEEVVYDLLDEGIELDAVEGAFTQYLEEATVTSGDNRPTDVRPGGEPENDMTSDVKKRRAEVQKKRKDQVEKFKKSVGKAVQGVKAKAHGGLADYAGKRKLIPTKGAKAAAAKPERVAPSEPKNKTKKAQKEFEVTKKGVEAANKDRAEKMSKRQRPQDIKKGLGDKEKRQGLRSAVFKDVKDRVGKKVQAVKDAPKKLVNKGRNVLSGAVGKVGSSLNKLSRKLAVKAESVHILDAFDTVTAYLIDEGFAKDFDHAQRIMVTLDSELIQEVHESQIETLRAYLLNEGKATPESGTGPYYNEKKPTEMQLKNREKQQKIKDLTNQGKHQEASKLYNTKGSM